VKRTRKLSCESVAIVLVAVTFAGLCLLGGVQYYRSKKAASPFETMKEQARTACAQCFSLSEKSPGASIRYRRGKVLVVEADTGEVTALTGLTMADLSPEVRAASPEEVGTIVCAGEVQQRQVSTYQDRQPAYQLYRDICIYDLTAESVILFETLSGGRPPPVKTEKGPKSGSDPVHGELISLLEALPVK
jgi:hypothetical protein